MAAEIINALVVEAAPYSETTLLLRLLTRERGIVRALAKGARRTGKKTAAASAATYEPFTWIEANLALRKADGLGTLTRAEVCQGWPWLRRELNKLAYASLGLEVLAAVAAHSPHERFYFEEGARFLTLLEKAAGPGSLACVLLLRLLHHAGFPPRVAEDVLVDRNAGKMPARLAFRFQQGMITTARGNESMRDLRLSEETVKAFIGSEKGENNWLEELPSLETDLKLNPRSGPAALRWLIRVWEDHLHTQFKAAEYLEKMVWGKK